MGTQKIRLIIVDDNKGYIEAVKTILSFRSDIQIIGDANDGFGFLELIRTQSPDVVLMDIHMPEMDGIMATKWGLIENCRMKILGLTMSDNPDVHMEMLRIGFSGGILKNQFTTDFDKALDTILNGGIYFPVLN